MVSRVGVVVIVVIALIVPALLTGSAVSARQPPTGTAMYLTQHDPRLCPSPRCGGY
jgi:hypothetical protein